MADTAAALRMFDDFTSVGATSFVVTKTDILQNLKWGKTYSLEALRRKLPAMVRTAAIRRRVSLPNGQTVLAGENLIIRPNGSGVAFVQLDDLSASQLDRVRPAVFIIHATSPGSHQAWIAVSGVAEGKEQFKEFMRRVRKAVGANDKSASHATRVAGTENFKEKYAPAFPVVTILESRPGRVMTPEQLQAMDLLAAPEPVQATTLQFAERVENTSLQMRRWPDYERCLAGAPRNHAGTGPDRSSADFFWCFLAIQRKWSVEETEAKLLEVSERARERQKSGDRGYAKQTVLNAAEAVQSDRPRSRA